jgi:hypothetical protein
VWLATAGNIVSGAYYHDMKLRLPSLEARDAEAARRLWEVSEAQCGSVSRHYPQCGNLAVGGV